MAGSLSLIIHTRCLETLKLSIVRCRHLPCKKFVPRIPGFLMICGQKSERVELYQLCWCPAPWHIEQVALTEAIQGTGLQGLGDNRGRANVTKVTEPW